MAALLWLGISLAAHAQTTVEYIHTDALGTPIAVTDANKVVIETTEYEPYGAQVAGPVKDGPGYTGHVQDAATGLTYMQQRYYDPTIGRFLSVDPVTADGSSGGNFNRYWYANNNPYKFTDPDGRFPRIGDSCNLDWCRQQSGGRFGDVGFGGKSTTAGLFRRHKTPESQERLIKSVGGDTETLKLAQETHKSFVHALISFVAGGGVLGGARNAETTVIGRVKDLQRLGSGERSLLSRLPNLGNPRANWRQNAGVLREEMRLGRPIRDASPGDTAGQFLNAERNLLRDRGWTFDSQTNFWMPPTP
ncbi:RHS repeat-associated core domain-containing protein [Pseudoxanthomonas sp. LARHCG66]